jgi:hypothetical protein
MQIKATSALLDVSDDQRAKLTAHLPKSETPFRDWPEQHRIPITLKGFIVNQWGEDDGTSIEFRIEVTDAEIDHTL